MRRLQWCHFVRYIFCERSYYHISYILYFILCLHIIVEDARLSEANPFFDSRFSKRAFSNSFSDGIMVVDTDLNRGPGTSPMDRLVTRAELGYRADINDFWLSIVRLAQDSPDDILRSRHIDSIRGFREVIGLWRNHSADVEDEISTI